jgi:hypothetical protein
MTVKITTSIKLQKMMPNVEWIFVEEAMMGNPSVCNNKKSSLTKVQQQGRRKKETTSQNLYIECARG